METQIKRGWYSESGSAKHLNRAKKAKTNEDKVRQIFGEYVDKYQMSFWNKGVSIHSPVYLNIDYDEKFEVGIDRPEVYIKNSRLVMTVFRMSGFIHITVY